MASQFIFCHQNRYLIILSLFYCPCQKSLYSFLKYIKTFYIDLVKLSMHLSYRGLIAFYFQPDVDRNHKIPSSCFYPIPSWQFHLLVFNRSLFIYLLCLSWNMYLYFCASSPPKRSWCLVLASFPFISSHPPASHRATLQCQGRALRCAGCLPCQERSLFTIA